MNSTTSVRPAFISHSHTHARAYSHIHTQWKPFQLFIVNRETNDALRNTQTDYRVHYSMRSQANWNGKKICSKVVHNNKFTQWFVIYDLVFCCTRCTPLYIPLVSGCTPFFVARDKNRLQQQNENSYAGEVVESASDLFRGRLHSILPCCLLSDGFGECEWCWDLRRNMEICEPVNIKCNVIVNLFADLLFLVSSWEGFVCA